MTRNNSPTLGADIEGFLYNRVTKEYMSAEGMLGGTKDKPKPIQLTKYYDDIWMDPEGTMIQEDNVMVEFNLPVLSLQGRFQEPGNLYATMEQSRLIVDRYLEEQYDHLEVDYDVVSNTFPKSVLDTPQAQTIGCEPDNDAYTGGETRLAVPPLTNVRNAGGHVHIGGNFQCPDFVACLLFELLLMYRGVPQSLEPTERDEWYGQPGTFRTKPYGIEYRSLNSAWVTTPSMCWDVERSAKAMADFCIGQEPNIIRNMFRSVPWLEVREAYLAKEHQPKAANDVAEQILELVGG